MVAEWQQVLPPRVWAAIFLDWRVVALSAFVLLELRTAPNNKEIKFDFRFSAQKKEDENRTGKL